MLNIIDPGPGFSGKIIVQYNEDNQIIYEILRDNIVGISYKTVEGNYKRVESYAKK